MQYLIYSAVLGTAFFLVCLFAYERGLAVGLRMGRGEPPEPIKGPVTAVREYKERKEAKAEADAFMQGLNNLFSYDGTPQKGAEDK